jgi:type II secretory pathway pseudopilin PulG
MKIFDLQIQSRNFVRSGKGIPRSSSSTLRGMSRGRRGGFAQGNAAFTMIEIAISLAVIAFALVAIIGVLPMGMGVQRENREETLVNQDGPYFIEAIRNGARGLDHLTNFVDEITIKNQKGGNTVFINNPPATAANTNGYMTNGEWIVSLLSTPKYTQDPADPTGDPLTNTVMARIHAISDAATLQGSSSRDMSFAYELTSEVVPFSFFSADSTNYASYYNAWLLNTNDGNLLVDWMTRSNRWLESQQFAVTNFDVAGTQPRADVNVGARGANLYEVKLTFRWPLLANGSTGPRRQIYRALVSSHQVVDPLKGWGLIFEAQNYTKKP